MLRLSLRVRHGPGAACGDGLVVYERTLCRPTRTSSACAAKYEATYRAPQALNYMPVVVARSFGGGA